MEIQISNSKLIEEVQQDFNEMFPFLRLKFLPASNAKATNNYGTSKPAGKLLINFGDLNNNINQGSFEITDTMTVRELENIFRAKFGIQAQVLRKSGNVWMEASITGHWSLSQQNEHGREISTSKD